MRDDGCRPLTHMMLSVTAMWLLSPLRASTSAVIGIPMTTFCVPSAAIDAATSRTIWTPGCSRTASRSTRSTAWLLALGRAWRAAAPEGCWRRREEGLFRIVPVAIRFFQGQRIAAHSARSSAACAEIGLHRVAVVAETVARRVRPVGWVMQELAWQIHQRSGVRRLAHVIHAVPPDAGVGAARAVQAHYAVHQRPEMPRDAVRQQVRRSIVQALQAFDWPVISSCHALAGAALPACRAGEQAS